MKKTSCFSLSGAEALLLIKAIEKVLAATSKDIFKEAYPAYKELDLIRLRLESFIKD